MKKTNKKTILKFVSVIFILITLANSFSICNLYAAEFSDTVNAKSAILMEASSGKILFEQNANEALPPASVTKIMTILLCMEAIDNGNIALKDKVTVSDHAASMGGSQVFLESGEQLTVEEMLKSVVVASANDAAVALAEHISGSEASFVTLMNKRASELGMENTNFENTNGLDDNVKNHVISAKDIAIMSRELLKHEKIFNYTCIWQDTIRDGAFTLSNTNRLIRFYEGANGLKTGSTSKAKFCISATAKRNDMQLICVIMGAPTRDIRNAEAKKLLDYGFSNYGVYKYQAETIGNINILGGTNNSIEIKSSGFECVLDKSNVSKIQKSYEYEEIVSAPIANGQKIGRVVFTCNQQIIGECDIVTSSNVDKISFSDIIRRIFIKMTSLF